MNMIKKMASLLTMAIILFATPVVAFADTREDDGLVVDYADILSGSEEEKLEAKLESISSRQGMDIVVLTVPGLEGMSPMNLADDFYDYSGYGQNASNDGVLLLLSMENRDWWFSTTGEAISAFNDAAQDYIFSSEKVLGYFGDNDWYGGFDAYADLCDECITAYKNGDKFPKAGFKTYISFFGLSAVFAFLITLIVMNGYRSKLKTVAFKAGAGDYLVDNSLHIRKSYDTFLYSNVVKTQRAESSGSSTHTSSSGTSHGGSGGKF